MKLHLTDNHDLLLVRAYDTATVTVGEQQYHSSLILTPRRIIPDWRPQMLPQLIADDFAPVLALEPEILLLGTGNRMQFPDPKLLVRVHEAAIGLEVMDTQAVCRTYNILASEGREVAAAILLGAG